MEMGSSLVTVRASSVVVVEQSTCLYWTGPAAAPAARVRRNVKVF